MARMLQLLNTDWEFQLEKYFVRLAEQLWIVSQFNIFIWACIFFTCM